ncbi:MAG: uroporphyrinogen-III C-methyltransferase [Gammaproteobacteria bacterium]|nr:uroporphyrinogen-III C-methyltransferase [Gammaproteobacteria bacterium]
MSKKDNVKDTPPVEEQAVAEQAAEVEELVVEDAVEDPVEEPVVEPAPETEAVAQPEAASVTSQTRGSGGIAWLGLFLSFVALAAAGYVMVQDWRAERSAKQSAISLDELRDRLASSNETLSNLDRDLARLAEADAQTATDLGLLQTDIDGRMQMLDSLPPRIANLENSLATLQGVSVGARNTWLIAEAEYYMQIANAQLQLAGNPQLAALALGMADERLVQLADPALTDVRRALSDELAALELMEKPDIEGVTLTLASLARVVDALPLKKIVRATKDDDAEIDAGLSGVDRAWASVKGAVSGLVRVSGPDESAIPLLTPDAVYFLRTNLTLQLQAARLALLRGEQAVFQQSLDDASAWLQLYFDADSTQVNGALQTIAEIRDGMFDVTTPDISESLRLLRQFKALGEPAQ